MCPESADNWWCGAHQRWVKLCMCDLIVCEAHNSLSGSRIGAVRNSSLQREMHSGEFGRCFPGGVAKRFELSTGLREKFPKLTTVSRDEAANMVAAGMRKVRDEADGWESQLASDHHMGCWDVQL